MLCFSSVPLFRSALSLRRYAYVSHCAIVCLHITLCTICISLYLVPRCDVLAALLYSTSLNHVLYWSCVIISGTELLLGRHIWLYSSHVVKYRIVQFLTPVTSYSIAVLSVGCVVLFSPLHIPYSTIHNKTSQPALYCLYLVLSRASLLRSVVWCVLPCRTTLYFERLYGF